MRHFQDEQSIPFEPAYEDVKEILPPSGTVETAAANTAIVNENHRGQKKITLIWSW